MSESTTGTKFLGIYLNDHLAASTAGLNLMQRIVDGEPPDETRRRLRPLVGQIAQDRDSLRVIMAKLNVSESRAKKAAAWTAERLGRLKLNGRIVRRSPVTSLLELEAMRLGVEGKLAAWLSLRELVPSEPRLDASTLEDLIARARSQIEQLEAARMDVAPRALTASP